jgi:putative aldouronate transport system substrate-binding protein
VDGVPTFKDEVVKTSELPKDYTQSQSVMRYSRAVWAFNMVKDEDYYPQLMDEKNCREAIYIWMEAAEGGGRKHELPNLFFTDSETASVGTILNQLKTHSNEQALLFILGTRDLSQWDTYVQEIANLKAAEAETIMNAAMARYQGR